MWMTSQGGYMASDGIWGRSAFAGTPLLGPFVGLRWIVLGLLAYAGVASAQMDDTGPRASEARPPGGRGSGCRDASRRWSAISGQAVPISLPNSRCRTPISTMSSSRIGSRPGRTKRGRSLCTSGSVEVGANAVANNLEAFAQLVILNDVALHGSTPGDFNAFFPGNALVAEAANLVAFTQIRSRSSWGRSRSR